MTRVHADGQGRDRRTHATECPLHPERQARSPRHGRPALPPLDAPHRPRAHRHEVRVRRRPVRLVHGGRGREGRPVLPGLARRRPGQEGHDDRRAGGGRQAPPDPAGVRRPRRVPVRLLHARDDHERLRAAPRGPPPLAGEGERRDGGQPLPLQRLQEDPGGHRLRLANAREDGHEPRPRPPLVPEARRRGHRRPRPARPVGRHRPGPRAIPPTSTPTSASARTAASPSSPERSRWGRAS